MRPIVYTLAFAFFACADSVSAPYPIVTSIRTEVVDARKNTYHFTQGVADFPDRRVPLDWHITFGHRHLSLINQAPEQAIASGGGWTGSHRCGGNCSLSEMAMDMYSNGGNSRTTETHYGEPNPNECIGYFATRQGEKIPWAEILMPAGACTSVSEGNQMCKITTSELVFDHGTLSVAEAEGHKANSSLQLQCTSGGSFRLTLSNGSKTIPVGGGTARLTTYGESLGYWMVVPPHGYVTVPIVSELHGVGPGEWTASAVLVVDTA